MTNTINKAINRLQWRLKNGWKANQNDVDAINFIIDFANIQQTENFESNELFAKLYIFAYKDYLKKFKGTVFDEVPKKELHKFIDKSLETHIIEFKDFLNLSEQYERLNEFESIKTYPKHLKNNSVSFSKNESKEVLEIINNEVWDYETVRDNLTTQINNVIVAYR